MAELAFRFLGDFEVARDGESIALPASRKTRALLAYLSLQPHRFRRERLCELLWDMPDDPRGALRWSLTKLRRLLEPDATRIVADRSSAGIDSGGIIIDVRALRAAAAGPFVDVPTAALEEAVERYRGDFLEGLAFSSFHEFHTWYVAEREQVLRDRRNLLTELLARLAGEPSRALPHARSLVGLFPYDEGHRAMLIRLLRAERRLPEAEEQYQLALRMLEEVGAVSSGALLAARSARAAVRLPAAGRCAVRSRCA